MMKQWLIRGRSEYLSSATPRLPSLRLCRLLSSAPRHIPLTLVPLPSLRNFHDVATSRSPGWRYRDRKPRQHLGCAAGGNQDWLDQAKLGRFDRGAQRDIVAGCTTATWMIASVCAALTRTRGSYFYRAWPCRDIGMCRLRLSRDASWRARHAGRQSAASGCPPPEMLL